MRPSVLIIAGVFAAALTAGSGMVLAQDYGTTAAADPAANPVAAENTSVSDALIPELLTSRSPYIRPALGDGFADAETVHKAVGRATFSVSCPSEGEYWQWKERGVRVDIERGGALPTSVINALVGAAQTRGSRECPLYITKAQNYRISPVTDFGFVDVFGPASPGGVPEHLIQARSYGFGRWESFHNIPAERAQREAEAQAQYQADLARQEAQQATAERRAQEMAVRAEEDRRAAAAFWGWVRLIAAGGLLLWLFLKRDALARWYYALEPHPVSSMVDRALYSGAQIDGELYERLLLPVPGDRNERAVRSQQAAELTTRLRQHEAVLRSEEIRRINEARQGVERENAFARAHAELLKAGVDHEIAAARVDELRRMT